MGGRKFAVLLCAEDSDYVKKVYGGYFGVFVRMLREEGEVWDVFPVARGEFPADGEISAYDGFVITGSCSDAHGGDLWICKLLVLLKRLDAMKKRVLGICFGHQGFSFQSWKNPGNIQRFQSRTGSTSRTGTGLPVLNRFERFETGSCSQRFKHLNRTGTRSGSRSNRLLEFSDFLNDLVRLILGRALGGRIGRASTGWDIGITKVHLFPSPIFTSLKMPDSLSVVTFHRDEESIAAEAKTKVEGSEPDREAWKKLCTAFLKGKL
ncbi:class I glutamine amidotransferase-likesuperfamily protein [Striga asiatica]|uniref:Class I glutamine amidotransferase-likesuperfamily protein n=1 Tax=Striga asiatica TaxID=4170 RepID=A0A5A7QA10_STRAF|nr:class I glutamine amidotransferase-likesuperfamily protein [Striga asiatica]